MTHEYLELYIIARISKINIKLDIYNEERLRDTIKSLCIPSLYMNKDSKVESNI